MLLSKGGKALYDAVVERAQAPDMVDGTSKNMFQTIVDEARGKMDEEPIPSECLAWGHDYKVVASVEEQEPLAINCNRCGLVWNVERVQRGA